MPRCASIRPAMKSPATLRHPVAHDLSVLRLAKGFACGRLRPHPRDGPPPADGRGSAICVSRRAGADRLRGAGRVAEQLRPLARIGVRDRPHDAARAHHLRHVGLPRRFSPDRRQQRTDGVGAPAVCAIRTGERRSRADGEPVPRALPRHCACSVSLALRCASIRRSRAACALRFSSSCSAFCCSANCCGLSPLPS